MRSHFYENYKYDYVHLDKLIGYDNFNLQIYDRINEQKEESRIYFID